MQMAISLAVLATTEMVPEVLVINAADNLIHCKQHWDFLMLVSSDAGRQPEEVGRR
jgi:hypothetical protein